MLAKLYTTTPTYLLKLGKSEVRHGRQVPLSRGEEHAIAVGAAVAQRAVVAAHQRQVGQHARLPVAGQVPLAGRELFEGHAAPGVARVAWGYLRT